MGDFDNIKTKTMKRGNPKESSWPSDYGAGDRGFFHLDKNTKELKPGFPRREFIPQEAPAITTDEMPPIESMATQDREIFTSKAKYRRHLKEHGFVESYGVTVKPEKPDLEAKRRELRDTIEKSYHDLKNDRIPLSEKEKEICRQENRKYQDWVKRNSH